MPGPPGGPSPFCFLDASARPVLRVMASGDRGESRADQVPAPGRGLSGAGAGAGAGAVAGVSARARASRLPTAPAPPCAHARAHAHALGSRTGAHARTLAPSVSMGTNVVTPRPLPQRGLVNTPTRAQTEALIREKPPPCRRAAVIRKQCFHVALAQPLNLQSPNRRIDTVPNTLFTWFKNLRCAHQ